MTDQRHFLPLRIADVRPEAAGSVAVTFTVPVESKNTFAFQPGQFLTLKAVLQGEEIRRSYSICSSRSHFDRFHEIRIGIRAVAGGVFSNWAVRHFKAGDMVPVMPPEGRFVSQNAQAKHRAAFASGSGITPVLSIMASSLEQQPDSRFTLVYGNRNMASVMFNEELQDLKDRYTGRVTLIHVLSRQAQEVELLQGRLGSEKVRRLLETVLPPQTLEEVFVCGPQDMIDSTCRALSRAGVPAERVRSERFVAPDQPQHAVPPAGAQTQGDDTKAVALTLILDGKQRSLRMSPDQKILDVGLAAGLDLPYSCRGGVCCTCRAKVMQGSVVMEKNFTLEDWETRQDFVLSCQSRPTSDAVTLSYDER
ncbi:MAG: 2Fe-2S iron-sulfur cluster binding domain-containing protein [Limnohabitans sp.]|nr:2Fe-2S iron-sulfur cluster binding domain-containing protein [Limnohabitans sp.]